MTARTRAQLNSDADTYLPDNTSGDISPADIRQRVKDLADSAKLSEDLATVASTGAYSDLTGKPTLGTAASKDTGTAAGQVPVLDTSGKLPAGVLPAEYATTVDLAAATVPATTLTVRVADYAVLGDGGGHRRKRVASQPAWGGIRSTDRFLPNGTTDNTNGGWWDVDEAAPNELMFGGVASNSNAVQTAAIQALLDYCYANPGRKAYNARGHTITAQINVPAGVCLEWGWGFPSAVFGQGAWQKGFNGDMIRMGDASMLVRPLLQGIGATYSGRGILVDQGNDQVVIHPFINDMGGPCIEFPTDSMGGRFRCEGGYFLRHNVTDPCIVMPATEATTFGYRIFNNPGCGGGVLFAFKNGNMTQVTGGFSAGLDFTGNTTGRVFITGHRCANALTTISGVQHHITHNSFGGAVTLDGSTSNVDFCGNIISGAVTLNNGAGSTGGNSVVNNISTTGGALVDNSGNSSNFIVDNGGSKLGPISAPSLKITTGTIDLQSGQIAFPATQNPSLNANTLDDYERGAAIPTWTGTTTNPSIGNGTLSGSYVKVGRLVHFDLLMQSGSTTTFGSGVWSFSLPFAAASTAGAGVVSGFDAGTANRVGAVQIFTTSTIGMVSDGGSNNWSATLPQTWANPDYLKASITYGAAQ
ncbi:MAG: hypothetical protein E5W06_00135 [Mesorhizobium sp.]|nr:MAG: hypothetical protein E5W06_00135 [Mesorhizobium sp.]